MVCNNAENKRQNTTLLQRQKTTLQRWIMTSKKVSFSTNI